MVSILIDEAHQNQISLYTFKGFEEILIKYDIIPYRLIQKPITSEQIRDEDILFIGVPGEHFFEEEVEIIQRFLEREKKIVIIVYGTSSEFNSNIGLIIQKYGIDFNHDLVHDKENSKMGQYIPLIQNFFSHFITKGVKKLNFSGSSLSIFDDSFIALAFSSETAIPPNKPVMAVGCNGQLIVIGGSSIFSDAEFGLPAENNRRCVENIIQYCLKLTTGRISPSSKESQKEIAKIRRMQERERKKLERQKRKERKKIKIKDIIKKLSKYISEKLKNLKEIEKNADIYWTKVSEQIISAGTLEQIKNLEAKMNSSYNELRENIESVRDEAFNEYYNAQATVPNLEEFQESTQEILNSIYITEAEAETKLDMVRNNLIQLFNNKKAEINRN